MTRRRVSLALALLAVALLAVGTGGFGSSEVDRGLDVAVVDDESALLGVEVGENDADEVRLDNGDNRDVTLVALENQAGDSALRVANLRVSPRDADRNLTSGRPPHVRNVSVKAGAAPTEKRIVAETVVCGNNRENRMGIDVDLTAYADGVAVELTRTVWVECTGDPSGPPSEGTIEETTDDTTAETTDSASG